ncbi:DUF6233 domain-containing protein [Streptomyces sp. NPDC089173]|uniref:DUF6233 domain-containing protein n=1 Tax=Streptomyces sp. NPDC089173 TaxID=3154965 RepID=UPI00344E9029
MYDLPPDLDRLRTLWTWHTMWAERIAEEIKKKEAEQKAEQQRAQRKAAATPDWVVELDRGTNSPYADVHTGGCHMLGKRWKAITREQAAQLINQGVNPCTHCRPDTELGLLE